MNVGGFKKKKKEDFSKMGCGGRDDSVPKQYSMSTLLQCVYHGIQSSAVKQSSLFSLLLEEVLLQRFTNNIANIRWKHHWRER